MRDHYDETTTRSPDGRVIVSLPFREGSPSLGHSKSQAVRRFFSVEAKLLREPIFKEKYVEFMREFISMGHLERVGTDSEEPDPTRSFYVPHHGVLKESSTTTKLRVVFDASAKTSSGVSLNDNLLVGPRIQDEIFKILVRFRFYAIGMAGDVAKMYRQIGLHEEDRDFHRLIWREDPNQPLEIFRMTRVTYGITSSSYHAIRALQSAADYAELPTTESALRRDFYVDDFLGGALDVDTAYRLKEDLTKSLSKVCMPIRKWSSNSAELLARIPEEDRETATVEVAKEEQGVKTLGIAWNTQRDKFVFTVPAALKAHSVFLNLNPKITRRGLLSATATIYDPLGWLAPLVIRMKILFQNSWDDAAGWDDVLSADKIYGFRKWIEDLLRLEFLELPRKILDISHPVDSVLELVLFCDASEQAMAACVYIVTRPKNYGDYTTSRLLAAKTKLAPRKTQTVPRLELGAMLLGARLVRAIQQSMEPLPFRIAKISAHTDSTVALAWVHSEPARWGVFVGNRVREIQELIPPGQWSHVTTDQNPADLATRDNVTSLEGLDFWWNGPRSLLTMAWAAHSENQPDPANFETPDVLAEVRKKKVVVGTTIIHDEKKIGVLPIETISDFGRLLRIAQTVLRVFKKKDEIDFTDSVKHRALTQLVKQDQEYHYGELFEILRGEKQLPSNHGLRKLNPILHEDGTIRVGGRLTHSALPEQTVRPFLLPSHSTLSKLLVKHIHHKLYHAGSGSVKTELRTQFWITGATSLIRKTIHDCFRCARYNSKPVIPLMGDLPEARVQPSAPFTHCGLDFAGPFYVHDSEMSATEKAYLLVLVCFSTKAVHLELTEGLAIHDTLSALKRFMARRGVPDYLYSDNGTGLMGAKRSLSEFKDVFTQKWGDKTLHQHVLDLGVNWQAIPPSGPHMGGIWEAAVKSAKGQLKRTFGTTTLTYTQLETAMCEIEAILNSRPLATVSDDEIDLVALTPSMLLNGFRHRLFPVLPARKPAQLSVSAKPFQRYRYMQSLIM